MNLLIPNIIPIILFCLNKFQINVFGVEEEQLVYNQDLMRGDVKEHLHIFFQLMMIILSINYLFCTNTREDLVPKPQIYIYSFCLLCEKLNFLIHGIPKLSHLVNGLFLILQPCTTWEYRLTKSFQYRK